MGIQVNAAKGVLGLPCSNRHFRQSSEENSRWEANKGDDGTLQKINFPHQNIWSLRARRNFLHEIHVHLNGSEITDKHRESGAAESSADLCLFIIYYTHGYTQWFTTDSQLLR